MNTVTDRVMDKKKVISNLNDLVELDFDAIAAYQAAIERIDAVAVKNQLTVFLGDHKRHIVELSEIIRREGGTPADDGDFKKILTKGKVVLADMGGDNAILKAMKANEEVTNKKYEKAVETGYASHIQLVLESALNDERRHKAWIEATIAKNKH